ncbi:DUF2852 domain-containing protein [Tabrizicola sp.]|uniref:DUF2852 domain-containing protein n=1 Tax=Tabrizicola sp. TaxID=2005166 RepID=UPI003F2C68A7
MYTTTDTARPGGIRAMFHRAEAWLDQRGKWAWITAMVLGFVIFWPVGLALLAYMIWGKQMFGHSCGKHRNHDDYRYSYRYSYRGGKHSQRSASETGNYAFDNYKAEALRRLEEEQEAFEAFLQRLRTSKDKTEFDSFMEERARATAVADAEADTAGTEPPAKPEPGARPGEY